MPFFIQDAKKLNISCVISVMDYLLNVNIWSTVYFFKQHRPWARIFNHMKKFTLPIYNVNLLLCLVNSWFVLLPFPQKIYMSYCSCLFLSLSNTHSHPALCPPLVQARVQNLPASVPLDGSRHHNSTSSLSHTFLWTDSSLWGPLLRFWRV